MRKYASAYSTVYGIQSDLWVSGSGSFLANAGMTRPQRGQSEQVHAFHFSYQDFCNKKIESIGAPLLIIQRTGPAVVVVPWLKPDWVELGVCEGDRSPLFKRCLWCGICMIYRVKIRRLKHPLSKASYCVRGISTRQSKENDHYLVFSTASPISTSFLCSYDGVNVQHPDCFFPPLPLLLLAKRKDLFSPRWKVRPLILQKARCVMRCLKQMHTDHFKDIWRPNGRWHCVAMAATCCTVLHNLSKQPLVTRWYDIRKLK